MDGGVWYDDDCMTMITEKMVGCCLLKEIYQPTHFDLLFFRPKKETQSSVVCMCVRIFLTCAFVSSGIK